MKAKIHEGTDAVTVKGNLSDGKPVTRVRGEYTATPQEYYRARAVVVSALSVKRPWKRTDEPDIREMLEDYARMCREFAHLIDQAVVARG